MILMVWIVLAILVVLVCTEAPLDVVGLRDDGSLDVDFGCAWCVRVGSLEKTI